MSYKYLPTFDPIWSFNVTNNIGKYLHKPFNCFIPHADRVGHGIPKVSHHLWLKAPNKQANINPGTINALKDKFKNMEEEAIDQPWQHVFWINNSKIKKIISEALKEYNIEYRNIYDASHHLQALDQISQLLEINEIGGAVDLLKYDIVNQHGGIVMDLNYELNVNPDLYFTNHDMILTRSSMCSVFIENYMIAAKPSHPVLLNFIAYIKNIVDEYFKLKEKNPDLVKIGSWTEITYGDLGVLYKLFSQTENNCDLVVTNFDTGTNTCGIDYDDFKFIARDLAECVEQDITNETPVVPTLISLDTFKFTFLYNHFYQPNYLRYCLLDQSFGQDSIDDISHSWWSY